MRAFLVEAYQLEESKPPPLPGVDHVSSIFLPEDDVCLHLMKAPSAEALRSALDAAAFAYERVVEARATRA